MDDYDGQVDTGAGEITSLWKRRHLGQNKRRGDNWERF